MDINSKVKIHNRFDIEVKDISTGEIVQKGQAENIVLDNMYSSLTTSNAANIYSKIFFGRGTGTLSPARTSLFSKVGELNVTNVETVYNLPPVASYRKTKIVLAPASYVGETITEVGIVASSGILMTHALIEDAEGNPLSIGPKTDTQEITIYSTLYAELILPNGTSAILGSSGNKIIRLMLGIESVNTLGNVAMKLYATTNKSQINQNSLDLTGSLGSISAPLSNFKVTSNANSGRMRFNTSDCNGKIWSLLWADYNYSPSFGVLLPNDLWQGYQFLGKNIGIGDGTKTKFILPWSDINTSKEYKFYADGALKTKDVDYTLANSENETSVTFIIAPVNNAVISGDWWVDYIPKDSNHVLDVTFTIAYGEGV